MWIGKDYTQQCLQSDIQVLTLQVLFKVLLNVFNERLVSRLNLNLLLTLLVISEDKLQVLTYDVSLCCYN